MKLAHWIKTSLLAVAVAACLTSPVSAQSAGSIITGAPQGDNAKPFIAHYYHLVFVVKELEAGKVINSRSYFMSVSSLEHQYNGDYTRSIRDGATVYGRNVGVNIDCRYIVDLPGKLAMNLSAEINGLQRDTSNPTKPSENDTAASFVMQQDKWNSQVLVALGKPTVVFSSDEVNSKRTMQLEITASEIQ